MSRLRKNNYINKTAASLYMPLDYIALRSGDCISFNTRILANRPWFEIVHEYEFSNSSYYDGSDFDRACKIYEEILLAFKGPKKAEEFNRKKNTFLKKIEDLKKETRTMKSKDVYPLGPTKMQPLFLGINDF